MTEAPKNPCITKYQSVQLKRLTKELTAINNAKRYKCEPARYSEQPKEG